MLPLRPGPGSSRRLHKLASCQGVDKTLQLMPEWCALFEWPVSVSMLHAAPEDVSTVGLYPTVGQPN